MIAFYPNLTITTIQGASLVRTITSKTQAVGDNGGKLEEDYRYLFDEIAVT